MKVGIVGAGAVGTACMFAMSMRGSAREIVLVNRNYDRARGAVADLQYGAVLAPAVALRAGDYEDLHGAAIVMITAGANEKTGGATDRNDPAGRLRLLSADAAVYGDIVPRIVAAAPDALLLVITDPPDPLADVARRVSGHGRVLSSGTFLDSSLSVSSREEARCRSEVGGGSGHRRARHIPGLSLVDGSRCRDRDPPG